VVVGATSTSDIAIAVRYAADNGMRIAVQATGHGLMADLDGTVLVTTRRMTDVAIDRCGGVRSSTPQPLTAARR
jgi:FAD/FMN-containing dehydrogenase